jgi:hypothetical protein
MILIVIPIALAELITTEHLGWQRLVFSMNFVVTKPYYMVIKILPYQHTSTLTKSLVLHNLIIIMNNAEL